MALVHSCYFEVHGKVQGVYFGKHTEKKAKSLGLRGWCMNTETGTVKGFIEGPYTEVNVMKEWLANTGSPLCIIHKAEFSKHRQSNEYGYKNFSINEKSSSRNQPTK